MNSVNTQRRSRTKAKTRDLYRDLPEKPQEDTDGIIDYAQLCKDMGRYDDGLDVLSQFIRSGELCPENWKAFALAAFFNLQRGETSTCKNLMVQACRCLSVDRRHFNCMKKQSVYNHFAYHYDSQLLNDISEYLSKRNMRQVLLHEITSSSEGMIFITEAVGRKIIAVDTMGNFLWGKSLNLAKKNNAKEILEEGVLMSAGFGDGVTLIDNSNGDLIQMDREGNFKTMAPLGTRYFKVHSFAQDYFGCVFVTENNPMRLSIFEPDGKLQREIFLDEVVDFNTQVNPFTIIYDEEGFLHLYNIDIFMTLNGEGRKIFRKDFVGNDKSRNDWRNISKGMTYDQDGRIYVARPSENRVLVVDKNVGTEVGQLGPELANTKLRYPTDVTIDYDDNLYINDSGHSRVLKINSRTGDVIALFQFPHWKCVF